MKNAYPAAFAALIILVLSLPAEAQTSWATPGGSVANGGVGMCLNATGQAVPCGAAAPTYVAPKGGPYTIAGCTVQTTSAQCLAAGTYNHVQIQNTSVSASVACSWGGAAALNSSGSVQLAAGQPALWGGNTAGAPSGVALNCIASGASTPLYLEFN